MEPEGSLPWSQEILRLIIIIILSKVPLLFLCVCLFDPSVLVFIL
jgi:hypothetical protein